MQYRLTVYKSLCKLYNSQKISLLSRLTVYKSLTVKALLPLHDQRGCLGVQNHPYSSSLTSIIILASLDLENYPSLDLNNLKTEMLLVLPSLETRQTLISLVLRLTQYTINNYTLYIMYIGSWQKRICIESMLLSLINLILNLK